MTVDFVIPHMGRVDMLHATVESVLNQTRAERLGRIIIVTKNRDLSDLPQQDRVLLLQADTDVTISRQRNLGAQQSQTETIAFLDADIELAPDWLEQCTALLEQHPEYCVVSAIQHCKKPDNAVESLRMVLSNAATDTTVSFLPGRNLLLRRKHHDAIGGFPEHLMTCEDYYYTDRIQRFGTLFYTSATHYFHLGEDTSLIQTFSKEIWRSESNLLSVKGRHIPLREWPSLLLPFWIFFSGVGLLLSLTGLIALPWMIISLLALLLPIAAYATRVVSKSGRAVPLWFPYVFYSVYFTARAIGTVKGIPQLWTRNV